MTQRGCPHEMDVEVYLLGALDPAERRPFVEHLPGCAACRAALAEGSGLPGLLARVPEPEAGPAEDPPPEILTAVVARVRGRRRARLALAAVSVLVALAGGVVLGGVLAGPPSTPVVTAAREVPLDSVGASTTYGRAELTGRPWGTAVDLQCLSRAAASAPPSAGGPRTTYVLVARAADGSEHPIARWSPPPGADAAVTASTDLPPDRLAGLEVRTDDGRVVMSSGA